MSDEQRQDEEVEGHVRHPKPDVEAHVRHPVNTEPEAEGEEDDVEAHIRKSNVRHDNVRHT
jgi:hypothetical protein